MEHDRRRRRSRENASNFLDHDADSILSEQLSVTYHPPSRKTDYLAVLLLCTVNMLNYMDRYTVSGVLDMIQDEFELNTAQEGVIQTVFICSYMVLAPIFGYLGDRYSRRKLMVLGLLLWSITTMSSSFVHRGQFGWFLFLRGCVGVGEASYSTIAPTIIADLFTKERRSKMLAIFYFAIPVGSGMGYIVGAEIAKAFNSWQWAFRFTPIIGFVCCVLLYFLLTDPVRGEAEGGENMHATSWFTDIKALSRNRSFMGNTFGFTCVTFAAGSLAVFGPQFMGHALRQKHHVEEASISLLFGIITVLAGFCGVAIGSVSSTRFGKYTPRADPIICAIGLLGCTPFLFLSLTLSKDQPTMTWIFIFVGETLLFLNWPIVTDMVLYTVLPTRRSTAEAMQILISHALGDAISPLLVGEIAKSVQGNKEKTEFVQWQALQYALFMTCFVTVVGGLFFFYTALYIEADRNEVDAAIHEVHKIEENATNGIPSSATQETLASRTEIVVS